MNPLTVTFLGTGGGRHAMCTQIRKTAGIRLTHNKTQIHLDPGPGALVHSIYAGLNPSQLSAVVVTHCHPDHYTDAEVLVEAMTGGATRRKGILAAARSVLQGNNETDRSISKYHQNLVGFVQQITPGKNFIVDGLNFTALRAVHGDEDAVSLRIDAGEPGIIGYTSDTELYAGISKAYEGLRLLILCTMWPKNNHLKEHLSTDDAITLISEGKPKCAVTTHFGIKMLNANPEEDARWIQEETGIPVIAATDGMIVTLADKIFAKGSRKGDEPRIIDA